MSRIESSVDAQETNKSNPLVQIVEQKIHDSGPISFDDYMSAWLFGATSKFGRKANGYYNSPHVGISSFDRKTNGKSAFITPPEYTPLYGGMMARQIEEMWERLDRPSDFKIIEMGAGNGTQARDTMRFLEGIQNSTGKSIFDDAQYITIDRSPQLREEQKKALAEFEGKHKVVDGSVTNKLPIERVTGVMVSTELPDAFPVKIVKLSHGEWKELYIDKGDKNKFREIWTELSPEAIQYLGDYEIKVREERPYPLNIAMVNWVKEIDKVLDRGYMLTVDYNCWNDKPVRLYSKNGFIKHEKDASNYLIKKYFGLTDITTGVDFQLLHEVGKELGLSTEGHVNLQGFLYGHGYDFELRKLPYNEQMSLAGYLYSSTAWDVLIQSKGVESDTKLKGVQFIFDFEHAGNGRSFYPVNYK